MPPAAAPEPAAANLCSPREVSALLRARGIRPSKALGQNFLVDRHVLDRIVAAADLPPGARVLEVGAGLGVLTSALLDAGARVTAVEKDPALQPILRERLGARPGFELVCGDALELDYAALFAPGACTRLVSNLPYSVGTRILLEVCRHPLAPATCLVMVQKEVADRLAAAPSTPDRGQAGVWIQQRYDVEAVRTVKPTCFWPQPEISSTVVRLVRHDRLPLNDAQRRVFEAVTKLAFMHRRKQMASIFRNAGPLGGAAVGDPAAWLASVGLAPSVRPEQISNDEWRKLACALADNGGQEA